MHEPATHATRRRRPRAVSFVASLLLLESLLVVLVGMVLVGVQMATLPTLQFMLDDALGQIVGALPGLGISVIVILAGGGLALAGVGLLHLREWAWVLAMALQGLGLAYALYDYASGQPEYVPLALGSFVVLVLNQREVRQAFDLQHEHG
jgi:hypothetical protein